MIALIVFVLNVLCIGLGVDHIDRFEIIPAVPTVMDELGSITVEAAITVEDSDEIEWALYHAEAMAEYADEFTALFNSYTYKVSKNGRSMVNGKFVKMGK